VVQRKESLQGNVLEIVFRITSEGDYSSTIADIVRDTISSIEKRFNFHISYNVWAIAPRTVQLERCLALLDEDCSAEGSGCQQLDKSSTTNFLRRVKMNEMPNDEASQPIKKSIVTSTKKEIKTTAPTTSTATPTTATARTTKGRVPTKTIRHVLELNASVSTDCLNGQWYRQQRRLRRSHTFHKNGTLVLNKLAVEDGGVYYCKVNGVKVLNLVITVLHEPMTMTVTSDAPLNSPKTSPFLQRVGLPFTLYCEVSPSGAGDVEWARTDKRPLREGVIQLDNALIFKSVSCEDVGNYTCTLRPVSVQLRALNRTVRLMPFIFTNFCPTK